jgi:hypothetical protein
MISKKVIPEISSDTHDPGLTETEDSGSNAAVRLCASVLE